jgi:hypothetical protein
MQNGPIWKARSFWENVAAGLFGTAVWWVGSRVLEPFWAKLSVATGWVGMSEWIHEAGWLAFLVTIALWYVQHVNRGRHPATPSGGALSTGPATIQPHRVTEGLSGLLYALRPADTKPRAETRESASEASIHRNEELTVREDAQAQHLSLSLHLRASKPIPHLRLKLTGLTRWVEEIQDFTPVLQFHRSDEPWEISRTGGEPLLHFDHPAQYQFCAFGGHAASLQIVTKRGRSGCPLHPAGTYRLEVLFEGFAESLAHTSFIRAEGGTAAFTTDPRQGS